MKLLENLCSYSLVSHLMKCLVRKRHCPCCQPDATLPIWTWYLAAGGIPEAHCQDLSSWERCENREDGNTESEVRICFGVKENIFHPTRHSLESQNSQGSCKQLRAHFRLVLICLNQEFLFTEMYQKTGLGKKNPACLNHPAAPSICPLT